jgi:hypothetical protein
MSIEWVAGPWDVTVLRPHHSAPPPFTRPPCPPGTVWDEATKVCRHPYVAPHAKRSSAPPPFMPPRVAGLGLTLPPAWYEVHAKGILVTWNTQHQALASYGVQDVVPGWTERDGIVLHAFSQWWGGTPKLDWQKDKADAGGVVVANLTDDHISALDQWAAEQLQQQVPGATILDAAASKALLALWGKTDGAQQSGVLDDYGMQVADLSPGWSTRDTSMLQLFQTWWNAQGKPAVSTTGTLDAGTSNALKTWFAERLASIPAGWVNPGAQPTVAPTAQTCKQGEVWDDVNKACQPLPAGVSVPGEPPAKSNAVWWVLGGIAVVGAAALAFGSKGVGAAVGGPSAEENPRAQCPKSLHKYCTWSAIDTIDQAGSSGFTKQGLSSLAGFNTSIYVDELVHLNYVKRARPKFYVLTVEGRRAIHAAVIAHRAERDRVLRAAGLKDNPSGYYVHVRGGNRETYGPYPTLQRAKTFARIGATKGAHDRVVLRGGRVVRHYRARTGESLVHA